MNKLLIAYFGSSDFSARLLEKLLTDSSMYRYIEVKLVITQPDQKVGRKQILTPTPVKTIALKHGLEILEIENLDLNKNLKLKIKNYDICLVYAYGQIIPKQMLNKPKYGFWCLHPSLLPKYRGTSPMATALINGDKKTGVTIIKMDEKIDHGPIIAQEKYEILPTDKRPNLEKKLTDLAFEMVKKTVFIKDSLQLKSQDHSLATYTKKLSKQDGFIDLKTLKKALEGKDAEKIYNLFRGLYPWPGIWTMIEPIQLRQLDEAKRLKITDMDLVNNKLIIKKVQLEGKNEVDFETFNKAYKIF